MPPLNVLVPLLAEVLQHAVLPAALAAAVLTELCWWLGGARLAPLGAAVGLAGGVLLGSWLCEALTLMPGESAWNRLPWVALVALVIGLVARLPWMPRSVGWLLRALTAAAGAWWLIPAEVAAEIRWLPAALAAVIFAEWALLEPLASRRPGGTIPMILALTAFCAGAVLIYAGTARLTDLTIVVGAALVGVGAMTGRYRSDGGGAVPGAVVLLPGVLLMGQQETFSEVPWTAFATAACAPLVLVLSLLPPMRSWQGRRLCLLRFGLILVPLAVAVGLAMQAGPLQFE